MSEQFSMTIDGRAVDAKATIEVRNPATGEVFAPRPTPMPPISMPR